MDLTHMEQRMQAECHLGREQLLIVAVSGGPDSLALFHALHTLGYKIIPAHFDHQLRSASADEASALAEQAARWGHRLVCGSGDVKQFARSERLSIEDAARILRYRFLFDQADLHQASAVVTAHTADDQVETVLMHFLRGAGSAGLAGMSFCQRPNAWSKTVALVRPLLNVNRGEILAYCSEQQLIPFFDETNTDARYTRNRIRTRLIPLLKRDYNPQIRQAILRLSQTARDAEEIAGQVLQQAWQKSLAREGSDFFAFQLIALQAEIPAVQRLLLKQAIRSLTADEEEVDHDAVERGVEFLKHPRHGREIQFVQEVIITRFRDQVIITRTDSTAWMDAFPQIKQTAIVKPGKELLLENGWRLLAGTPQPCSGSELHAIPADPNAVWIDADKLGEPLQVRRYSPGEKIQPFGMNGKSMKVSDLLINKKIPRRARAGYAVVVCGNQVVWVPGCRLAHPFRITPETKNCMSLRLVKPR